MSGEQSIGKATVDKSFADPVTQQVDKNINNTEYIINSPITPAPVATSEIQSQEEKNVDDCEFQNDVVKQLYYLWIFHVLTMCLNVISAMLLWFVDGQLGMFGLAIFYCILFTPASFFCWYRPGNKALLLNSSINFMIFFFVFFFQMLVTVFQTIGLPSAGTCGFIVALEQFHGSVGHIFIGIFCFLIAVCFGICAAGDAILFPKVHLIYCSSGASFAEAQAEFTNKFVSSGREQQAAATVAVNNTKLGIPR